MIFSPSTLDTTAKILALGTIQCPCYTACSANLMRIIPKKFLQCSTKGIASSIVSVSFEGETFVTRDELKKVRTIRQFALKNRITAFLFIKTETRMSKREKTVNRSGYQNRKTGDFECKNRKTDLKSDQNRKTEKPNVPLKKGSTLCARASTRNGEFNMAAMFTSTIEVAQCFCLFLHLYWGIKARV